MYGNVYCIIHVFGFVPDGKREEVEGLGGEVKARGVDW